MINVEIDVSEVAANARRVLADYNSSASCFRAIALLGVDHELAKQELRRLLQLAPPDGFPPPALARAVWRVYQATKDIDFLREVLPTTMRFFRWLKAYRDPDDDHLIAIIRPDESGLDASPKYDVAMNLHDVPPERFEDRLRASTQRLVEAYAGHPEDPARMLALDVFNWEDVMVNSIYADGLQCLGGLCREAGYPPAEAAEFERRARRVLSALEEKCWDERSGVFWDLYGYDEQRAHVLTFTSLFPLIIDSLDRHMVWRLVEEHLLNDREFWLPFPVPSVAANEPSFDPEYRTHAIWRGPTSMDSNFYLYWGLRAHGYRDVATELAKRTLQMVSRGGLREFFNPYTGEGLGAENFGWAALVLDVIHAEGWNH